MDEALRTKFICPVDNQSGLKALFNISDNEITFSKALWVAQETKQPVTVANQTVFGQTSSQFTM